MKTLGTHNVEMPPASMMKTGLEGSHAV